MSTIDLVWREIQTEAKAAILEEPVLASFYHSTILNHDNFSAAISFHLANLLDAQAIPAIQLCELFEECLASEPAIAEAMCLDAQAYQERDPACEYFSMPFLYFKGYHALQAHRISHWLWRKDRKALALYLQNIVSQNLAVDIHPGAKIGSGIMIDHATGVVMGETVVMGDNVSMLHAVTLGGSGCALGDRHPKIGSGVLIGAGAKILGNIRVGEGAKIAAGSLVLKNVAAHTTVAGVPAKVVAAPKCLSPARDMDHQLNDD